MRLFAALELSEAVRADLAAWWCAAAVHLPASEWRDVPKRNWHLTLAFYGEVEGGRIDDLAGELANCASSVFPIHLMTKGFGVFPRPARPRVFWAGVVAADGMEGGAMKGAEDLKYLARCCRRAGHATLRKHTVRETPFRAHITVARAGSLATPLDAQCLLAMPETPQLAWTAGKLVLYASTLTPQGARYRRVEVFELEGNEHVR